MPYLKVIVLSVLLFSMPSWAIAAKATGKAAPASPAVKATAEAQNTGGKAVGQKWELTVAVNKDSKGIADPVYTMGSSLRIKVTGERAKKIRDNLDARSLTLYLNGVVMKNLPLGLVQNEAATEINVTFDLIRNADQDDNRKAWDLFFKKAGGYLMDIEPALAIGGDLPTLVYSPASLHFCVAPRSTINFTIMAGLLLLAVLYYLLVSRTNMLRDEQTGYYSLGKSQMAFWGLLVLLGFAGVWFLTGTMERIPPQTLILLGISGATGMGAIVIGDNKRAEIRRNIARLEEELSLLQARQANDPQAMTASGIARLVAIPQEIGALTAQLGPGQSRGFWRDICDDGNGASFHRFQVVLWTMVLGAVFVGYMAQMMSMPEFSETLLILMGISNVTYLGFKIPERP